MDVKNVLLQADLQETVHISLPPGYKELGCRLSVQPQEETLLKETTPRVCNLLISLCDLKQVPR